MKKFRQWLTEVNRSPEKAKELIDKLHSRKLNHPSLGKFYINPEEQKPQMKPLTKKVSEYPKLSSRHQYNADVPVNKIYTRQDSISPHVVKQKIDRGAESPSLYHVDGKYYVDDGNHSIAALRAQGHKTIRARVYDKEDKK